MAPTATDIVVFAVWLSWTCLSHTPAALKNGVFALAIPTQEVLKQILLSSEMTFAPGLLDVLQSKAPPTISYFKSLPLHLDKRWGVYIIVLERPGTRPKVYTGSDTHHKNGIATRMGQYRRGEMVPMYVQRALDDGYKITHEGLLCWSPLPTAAKRYQLRALFLLVECAFSLYFWTMVSRTKDYGMPRLCPWPLGAIEYDGCCSHTCLNEKIEGAHENLTPEQIDALDSERQLKNSRRDVVTRGPERTSIAKKKTRAKALATKKFSCDLCNIICSDSRELENHKRTQKHKLKAAGITKAVRTSTKRKELHSQNRTQRKYYCSICDFTTTTQQNLDSHRTSKRHLKKEALQSSS
jgi:hypothetical protein